MKRHHPEFYQKLLCDQCSFVSVNLDALRKHLQDHKLGLIRNEDSNDGRQGATSKLIDTQPNSHNRNVEVSWKKWWTGKFDFINSMIFDDSTDFIRQFSTNREHRFVSAWRSFGHRWRHNTSSTFWRGAIPTFWKLDFLFHMKKYVSNKFMMFITVIYPLFLMTSHDCH